MSNSKTFNKFVIVGIINTVIGTSIMFVAYNLFGMGYWISTFLNYFIGSIISYILNKYYTSKSKNRNFTEVIKFIINIIVCYLIAYTVAKNILEFILNSLSSKFIDNISMIFGMIIFVILNYFGQKYFVFKVTDKNIYS
ncbi:GtrA family protein [Solibacillus merdavium]|nr:GtrA family protein [Solibacillus merdavium]